MESKQKIESMQITKPKKPETKTQPKLQRVRCLEDTTGSIDSSALDLCVNTQSHFIKRFLGPITRVYIRPTSINILPLLRLNRNQISYIFEGTDVEELRKRFETALKINIIKPERYEYLRIGAHLYEFSMPNKKRVYNAAKALYTKHNP